MARRKNASFTGSPLAGRGPRALIKEFYSRIDHEIPGNEPVPIPPPDSVLPKHDARTQVFIFADYAVRKFAPIMLDARGGKNDSTNAAKLRALPKIVDQETALHASTAASPAAVATVAYAAGLYEVAATAAHAAEVAHDASRFNPDATWAAVNEMLAAL